MPSANAAEHHDNVLGETQNMTKRMSIKTMRRKLGSIQHSFDNSPCDTPVRSIVKDITPEAKIGAAKLSRSLQTTSPEHQERT